MSANPNASSTRQRATLACDTCRSRRTKCDARKPVCSFCEGNGIPCIYRTPGPPTPSRNESELHAIRERLDHLSSLGSLLSMRFLSPNSVTPGIGPSITPPRFGPYPMDESIISRNWRMEFPFMTVQTPSMMTLLGLNPKLAAQLVIVERTNVSMLTPPGNYSGQNLQYQDAVSAFGTFCDKIHPWYPILHPGSFDLYLERVTGELTPSPESCLVLLTAAIGSVAQCPSIVKAYEKRPDAGYIEKALSMLPNVHYEFSLRSAQCLVLLGIYYNCIAKPCQAHDYILMASCKVQALFKCHLYADDNKAMELLRRIFWSILLIETELGYHIDMPESNIWKFDDRILLPGIHDSWQPFHDEQRHMFDQTLPLSIPTITQNDAKAYFLAEISMSRMIRRCTTAVTISYDQEVYAPIIAAELAHQLERWHDHLPQSLRFDRIDSFSGLFDDNLNNYTSLYPPSSLAAVGSFLQMQHYICLTGIYWPAVYSAMYVDSTNAATLSDCARFFEAYVGLVASAGRAIRSCSRGPWSLYASLFITTMAANKSAQVPCLQSAISPAVMRCCVLAADIFDSGQSVDVSPSLRTLRSIILEHVKNKA